MKMRPLTPDPNQPGASVQDAYNAAGSSGMYVQQYGVQVPHKEVHSP